jgi:LPXTG-site transpeptidase (sortase) family protein
VPVGVRIPAIGVEARVVSVGIEPATGEMEVPKVVSEIGWYRYGPGLGAPTGSTVLAGHVDDAIQGLGVFARLLELHPGDTLIVTGGDRKTRSYKVVSREIVPKTSAPLDRVFARDGAPRLTLVTCGGSFDRSQRSYRDNVIVTAVEVAG